MDVKEFDLLREDRKLFELWCFNYVFDVYVIWKTNSNKLGSLSK